MLSKNNSGNHKESSNFSCPKGIILFFLFFFLSIRLNAQCAMCRAALEGEGNVKKAEAVNDGIVYLMLIPYILVVVIGYAVYRLFKKKKD